VLRRNLKSAPSAGTGRMFAARWLGWSAAGGCALAGLVFAFLAGYGSAGANAPVQVAMRPDAGRAIAAGALAADDQTDSATGTYKGVVLFEGAPPKREIILKKGDKSVEKEEDRAVCAAEELPSDKLIIKSAGGENAVANVVVYLRKA